MVTVLSARCRLVSKIIRVLAGNTGKLGKHLEGSQGLTNLSEADEFMDVYPAWILELK